MIQIQNITQSWNLNKDYKLWKTKKIKQQQKPKRNTQTTKQNKTKDKKKDWSHFPNDFSDVVYLFLHQNLLSTIHLRYGNYVIC